VIRDAIREKKMAALGRIVLTRREHVVMLEAFDKGLLATTLRYDYEVRDQKDYFEDIPEIKLPEEMKRACHAHHRYQGRPLRPEGVRDHYEKAIVELCARSRPAAWSSPFAMPSRNRRASST